MSDPESTRDLGQQVKDESARLSALAARSADICVVGKAIAIADSNVQALYVQKLSNPDYEPRGVECLSAKPTDRYSYVVFRFVCTVGAICIVDPSFLVIVDNWTGQVSDIIDPYIPHLHAPHTAHAPCVPTAKPCCPEPIPVPIPTPCPPQPCPPATRAPAIPCGPTIMATREYFLGEIGPNEELRYCFTHFQDERRDCWRRIYAEISYPNPDDIHTIVRECLQAAGIAALLAAYSTGGGAIPVAVATFREAFNVCMVTRIGRSIGIDVYDHKSCNDWDNH